MRETPVYDELRREFGFDPVAEMPRRSALSIDVLEARYATIRPPMAMAMATRPRDWTEPQAAMIFNQAEIERDRLLREMRRKDRR